MKKIYLILFAFLLLFHSSIAFSQNAVKVQLADVQKKNVSQNIDLSGTVEYPEISSVATEIAGIVEKVYFEEGEKVRRGDTLVLLNCDVLLKEIAAAVANFNSAFEEYQMQKWDYERYDTLYQAGDIPLKSQREKQAAYLKSQYNSEKAKAELERLQQLLNKKSILAPFTGVILKKLTNKGNWIEAGESVAILASDSKVDVLCNVPQDLISTVSKGDEVDIFYKKNKIKAKVFSVIPNGNINTRTFPIRIRMNNEHNLMNGMEVKVSIQAGKQRNSFLVSRDAIVTRNDKYYVYATENGKAKEIEVDIRAYQGLNAEVESTLLKENMKVVVRGNQYLSNGQAIEVVK